MDVMTDTPDKDGPSGPRPPSPENPYFSVQAGWGISKHFGGQAATSRLAKLCDIGAGTCVLVVGCGTGVSACYLAEHYGAIVSAIDVSPGMVERARQRVKRRKLDVMVDVRRADATDLPYEDNIFDVVMCESVNAFIPERHLAMREYYRVLVPGSFLGINECIWLREPPAPLRRYITRIMSAEFPVLTTGGWDEPVAGAGFDVIYIGGRSTTIWRQWREEMRQMDLRDFVHAWGRLLLTCPRDAECRRFVLNSLRMPPSAFRLLSYFGYELCVGKKPVPRDPEPALQWEAQTESQDDFEAELEGDLDCEAEAESDQGNAALSD
jgi:arsenite methyltransferase